MIISKVRGPPRLPRISYLNVAPPPLRGTQALVTVPLKGSTVEEQLMRGGIAYIAPKQVGGGTIMGETRNFDKTRSTS